MEIERFIEELSSSSPTPGGGGASGLVAAIGMSLGNMVLSLTNGKKKYAQYQKDVEECIERANNITKNLMDAIKKDEEAFTPLSKAYGLPKSTKEETEYREKVMEEALVLASQAPLDMMELICQAINLIEKISIIGSRLAISDAGVGIQFCKAALNGASLNVFINTKLMKNRECADKMNFKANELIEEGNSKADRIYQEILKELK